MKIKVSLSIDISRSPKVDNETGLGSDATVVETYTGPSMGFRLPEPEDKKGN